MLNDVEWLCAFPFKDCFNEAANVPSISLSIAIEMVIFPPNYVNTGADDADV